MPKFRGLVTITGHITIPGDDMYDADEKAQRLTVAQVLELLEHPDVEVFPHEFPYEV